MTVDKEKRKAAPRPPGAHLLRDVWRYGVAAPGRAAGGIARLAGHSAYRLVHWATIQAWHAIRGAGTLAVWALGQPLRLLGWLFGYGTLPAFENVYQQEAYLRIKRRYRRHWWRSLHAIVWLTFTLGLALQLLIQWTQLDAASAGYRYFLTNQFYSGLFIVGMWGLVLLVQGLYVRTKDREDEALADALERYRDYTPREKRKGLRYEEILEPYTAHDEPANRLADDADAPSEHDWAQTMTAQHRVRTRRRRG
jgi:hypothetical protein